LLNQKNTVVCLLPNLREDSEKWNEKFRGRKKNEGMHQEIAQALFEGKTLQAVAEAKGKTLQAVAEATGASLSTVKRVKAKIMDNDEMGNLRGRGHGRHGGRSELGERGHGGRGEHGGRGGHEGRGEHGRHGHHAGRGGSGFGRSEQVADNSEE